MPKAVQEEFRHRELKLHFVEVKLHQSNFGARENVLNMEEWLWKGHYIQASRFSAAEIWQVFMLSVSETFFSSA